MSAIGQHQQVEILVRLDQLVDDEQRVVGRNVGVHRAVREEQLAFQILRDELIGLVVVVRGAIRTALEQPLPLFRPVVLVHAVVVIAGLGDPDLEEIREAEHRGRSRVAAAGMAVDSSAVDVDPGEALRDLLHPGHLIRDGVVAHVRVVRLVELLRTPGRAHAVDLDHDQTEFGERLRIATRG